MVEPFVVYLGRNDKAAFLNESYVLVVAVGIWVMLTCTPFFVKDSNASPSHWQIKP